MDFTFTPEEEAFRARLRAFLAEHSSGVATEEEPDRDLERKLAEHGWLTMAWPKEYGGGGASHIEQLIFKEEMYRAGASYDQLAINLAGPTIMVHGSGEQKREHLPYIARAERRWCQGFSEPGAGSDLASLQTRAVRDGDDYIINGQKIWTSNAHNADYCLLLARTDPEAPKHRGISMFLVDMKSPGIRVQPLIQMTGVHGFNQVFFDEVRVPVANRLGDENRGWYVATTTLDFERSGIERNLTAETDWNRIYSVLQDPTNRRALAASGGSWRHKLADLRIEIEVGRWMARRVAYMQNAGLVPNAESSMSKGYNSEVGQRVDDFGVNVFGLASQLREGRRAALGGRPAFRYL
ncbi:MAG: acyl-CoA dehydrogenase family protein, partial [Hyphomicrobiales bacterium]